MPFRRTASPSTIVVFGRGTESTPAGIELTGAARRRVEAALEYVQAHRSVYAVTPAIIVFSGGWGGAAAGIAPLPKDRREAILLRDYAQSIAADNADLFVSEVQAESSSTLQDVLLLRRFFIEADREFSPGSPLGLVAQRGHLHRIVFLVRRIMRLRRGALVAITAPGPDQRSAGLPEWLLTLAYRVLFIGDPSEDGLRKSEERLAKIIQSRRRYRAPKA